MDVKFIQKYDGVFHQSKLYENVLEMYIRYFHEKNEYDKSIGFVYNEEYDSYHPLTSDQMKLSKEFAVKLERHLKMSIIQNCNDEEFDYIDQTISNVKRTLNSYTTKRIAVEYGKLIEKYQN